MKKIFILLILFVSLFVVGGYLTVKAENDTTINYLEDKGDFANCDGIITQDGLDIIKDILNWIRIIAPILLVIFVSLDFATAVISQDNDALKKAGKKVVPRLIATALLFFVPTFVRAILSIDGVASAITIPDDPLCHTMREEIILNNKISI